MGEPSQRLENAFVDDMKSSKSHVQQTSSSKAEASTDTETATFDHHPHNHSVFSQGLAGICEPADRLRDKRLTACLFI